MKAVSGTFDVDRCDYLLRDSYMTGTRYGLYDLDRLERMILKQVATDFFVLPVDRAAPPVTLDDRAAVEMPDEG